MVTKRILRIDRLVVAIPDNLKGTGSNGEVTIDDALQFLLDYRKTVAAKKLNKAGNFEYLAADFPDSVPPDETEDMPASVLLQHLWDLENRMAAGIMCTCIRDPELGEDAPYRNIYNDEEMQDYREALRNYQEMQKVADEMQGGITEMTDEEILTHLMNADKEKKDITPMGGDSDGDDSPVEAIFGYTPTKEDEILVDDDSDAGIPFMEPLKSAKHLLDPADIASFEPGPLPSDDVLAKHFCRTCEQICDENCPDYAHRKERDDED